MRRLTLLIGVYAAIRVTAQALGESPAAYNPPIEIAALKEAPGVEVTNVNCRTCHSADYITTQPRGAGFGREFWQAEVTKMIRVYGAPITESDAKVIVDYLSVAYR